MADQKISQLTPYTTPISTDVLPIVDVTNSITKKISLSSLRYLFNVKDYGAKGDGSTDDTTAIQATYTAAAVNGGIIFFPSGTYITNAGVTGNSGNVIWRGSGNNSVLKAGSTNIPLTLTGSAFVEDMTFDGGGTAPNAAKQSVITESSFPSLWKNVVWQSATSYQYINSGCEDVTYLECRTQGDESLPATVPNGIQISVPFGMVNIIGGSIFGKCDLNYQQIQITGATIGPLYIENPNPQNNTVLSLNGCYIYDGGSGSDNCINTGTNLTNIIATGCYFVGQIQRAWMNGNLPAGTTITIDNCIFIWGPGTSGNNYILQASGAGTLEVRSYSTGIASATMNLFNPVSSPTTIIRVPSNEEASAVASANNLTLPIDASFFQINGSTNINLINTTYRKHGDVVYLNIQGSITIKNNQSASGNFKPIILNGGVDFVGVANNTLTLAWDSIGNAWFELARKV